MGYHRKMKKDKGDMSESKSPLLIHAGLDLSVESTVEYFDIKHTANINDFDPRGDPVTSASLMTVSTVTTPHPTC